MTNEQSGRIGTKASTILPENTPETKMEMDFMKSTSTRWKDFGRCFSPGYNHIGGFPRKSCLFTSDFSSSSTMSSQRQVLTSIASSYSGSSVKLFKSHKHSRFQPWIKAPCFLRSTLSLWREIFGNFPFMEESRSIPEGQAGRGDRARMLAPNIFL